MSVRRETVSDYSGNSSGLMKSALFWVSMMTASFLLGFLVFAPLMHMARTKSDTGSGGTTSGSNRAPKTLTTQNPAASPPEPRRLNVESDEPVNIVPAPNQPGDSEVQPAVEPTDSPSAGELDGSRLAEPGAVRDADENPDPEALRRSERGERFDSTDRTGDRGIRREETDRSERNRVRDAGDNEGRSAATEPRRSRRSDRVDRNDQAEQPSGFIEDGRSSSTSGRSARRSSRHDVERTAERRQPRTREDDVQKSEGIDR